MAARLPPDLPLGDIPAAELDDLSMVPLVSRDARTRMSINCVAQTSAMDRETLTGKSGTAAGEPGAGAVGQCLIAKRTAQVPSLRPCQFPGAFAPDGQKRETSQGLAHEGGLRGEQPQVNVEWNRNESR